MPYSIDEFKNLKLYSERASGQDCDLEGGKILRSLNVSEKIKDLLNNLDPESHGGDKSRQDSAIVTSMLSAGYKPADVYSTFLASLRGQVLEERRPGHSEDYLRRTIEKASGFLQRDPRNEEVKVDFSKRRNGNHKAGLIISMASDVEVEKVEWIWKNYIPAGKLTILAGDPGMGKSTITLDLLSRISRGTFLPTGERSVTGSSLIASAEDAAEDTLTPRLITCDANLTKIGIIREVRDEGLEEKGNRYLSFPRDLDLLKEELKKRGARILVIDPLNAFLEGGVDTYKDQDMRRVLHPLEDIAEESGTAILVVAHLTKKEETSTLYRVGGSIGFIGAARSVLAVSTMEDDTRVLYSLKCNLSQRPPSLCYETKQVRKIRKAQEWKGEDRVESNSIRWLGEVDFNPTAKANKNKVSNNEACDFLRQILEDCGELPADQVFAEARLAGFSKSELSKTRTAMGIKSIKKNEVWFWQWSGGE